MSKGTIHLYDVTWTDSDGHTHVDPEYADLDLGDDHFLSWSVGGIPDDDGIVRDKTTEKPIGGLVYHRRADAPNGWCIGAITFDVPWLPDGFRVRGGKPAPLWSVASLDPLDISPSLACRAPINGVACTDHGFIHGGKWQRA